MNVPRLSADGFVDHHPAHSYEAINYVLDYSMVELRDPTALGTFLSRAATLAIDVHACGLAWEPAAQIFREFARPEGMGREEVDRLLALAWEWAADRPNSWLQLSREWIVIPSLLRFYHLASGRHVHVDELDQLFLNSFQNEDEEVILGHISLFVHVDRLMSEPSKSRGFHLVENAIVFNAP